MGMLVRSIACGCLVIVLAGCSPARGSASLEFLTSGSCVNTPAMRANLDAALKALGKPSMYVVTDLDTLSKSDLRRGYPTPTLLLSGNDLFDLPKPAQPLESPT